MGKKPYLEFFINDFRADTLHLSATSTGIWIRALCDMAWQNDHKVSGTLDEICRICGCTLVEWADFVAANSRRNVAPVTQTAEIVTVISRRRLEEHKEREQARLRKQRGRESRDCPEKVTFPLSSSSSSSKKRESDVGPSDTPLFAEGTDPSDLAQYLRDCILENDEKSKVPDLSSATFQKWCLSIDRLIRLDNREPEVVAAIIHWCQDDSFWAANIQSADKLRKQFSRLYLQAKEAGASLRFVKE